VKRTNTKRIKLHTETIRELSDYHSVRGGEGVFTISVPSITCSGDMDCPTAFGCTTGTAC
jgi:hypothetical protein